MRPGGIPRRGVTLVEAAVAMVLAGLIAAVGWNLLRLDVAGEKSTDRSASRALTQALLLEFLLRDLRSSVELGHLGERDLRIRAWGMADGRLALREIVWRTDAAGRVERRAPGEPTRSFDFSELLEPGAPPFTLRVREVESVLFDP